MNGLEHHQRRGGEVVGRRFLLLPTVDVAGEQQSDLPHLVHQTTRKGSEREEVSTTVINQTGTLVHLGHVHSKQVLLGWLIFADALSHHQHQVLFAATKRHQVLVGVSHQHFLNTTLGHEIVGCSD